MISQVEAGLEDLHRLARAAEAVQADLDNARSLLQKTDIEWKLDRSEDAAVMAAG